MKQNIYSEESGTARIDTCNGKDYINKEQISDVIDGLTSVNSMCIRVLQKMIQLQI